MKAITIAEQHLAHKYAKAFLNVFWQGLQPIDFKALEKAKIFFEARQQACFLMRLSLLSKEIKHKALKDVRIELGLPGEYDEIIKLLIDHKRSFLLDHVFTFIAKEAYRRLDTKKFVVSSVGTLDGAQKKKIIEFLEHATGKTVTCVYRQDPKLIAGLRLQSDQLLWEASIEGRLKRMRSSLKR